MNPKFSIVITTFNRSLLLKRALDSLIAQTESGWEAWLIDDGSVDDTREVVLTYLERNIPVHYIYQENSGDAGAKNKGISLCTGQYISFLDSDDEYLPHHLESRKLILDKNPEIDLLHGGVKIVGDPYVPNFHNPDQKIHLSNCVIGSSFIFKRQCLLSLRGFNQIPLGSDADLFNRTVNAGFKILKTEIPTYIYHRTHPDSITHNFWKK